jgi:hypothetical protein
VEAEARIVAGRLPRLLAEDMEGVEGTDRAR